MVRLIAAFSILFLTASCAPRSSGPANASPESGAVAVVQDRDAQKKAVADMDPTVLRQQKELRKGQDEKEDVERQKYHDQKLEQYLSEHN